jgi:hypothetical protein
MLRGRRGLTALALLTTLTVGAVAFAQFGGRFRTRGVDYDNVGPETEFTIVRWRFGGGLGGYFSDGWSHDYPAAEEHILQLLSELTLLNVDRLSYRVLDLSSPEIFDYPFSYMSHPGDVELTEAEVDNLREYIARGGFIMQDDFGGQGQGPWEFETARSNLLRAFPDREMFELSFNHGIFHSFYDVDPKNAEHPMSHAPATFLGFPDDRDGISMIICYANDVGDYWEFLDNPRYRLEPSAEAVRMGVNFVLYSMTH